MPRQLNDQEWQIVQQVFGDTLPYRWRILVTSSTGAGGAPFTIPTSAISVLTITLPWYAELGSAVNAGYIMNVGSFGDDDMSASSEGSSLLVHEMTHVWQGKNSVFSLTYVYNSLYNQCKGMIAAKGSLEGRNSAYNIDRTNLGAWSDYNAEQQANIVETWYKEGMDESSDLFQFISDNVRQGTG
jgi:hypothetical protein